MAFDVSPIGIVRSERAEVMDDNWGSVESVLDLQRQCARRRLDPRSRGILPPRSGLRLPPVRSGRDDHRLAAPPRHPRGDTTLPRVGVLAQRVKDRPNHLGVSRCEIVDVDGLRIRVRGLDAIDGTPVFDVKPFLQSMVPEREDVKEPTWVASVMKNYF